ncbi:hypothetical protein FZI85_20495 [Mycobacterium sp. CBMA293]|uniref:DUF7373 family lipoprotein n=1 Tax=unclassified Mycolicibacterium TaxID=2636767 RepID=UPI0012DCF6ED|nr:MULTISPECIES: hypothetical protein [unclassified Mycolicibacterium]MUL48832.1 hypothetical protein [Mycolicibacterium sp. CBMA 360]MUL62442.1 hypothetical protein [Mycolicibacterium sp. CBMA 335]MUL74133.1 hypothetical protein [Mycolicibacterium sp. CBMA 311]MUL96827.1 hypothetical protein [Mycolicibacterium sp. CBMA 230]MUM03874.1 hypothetical protein [Mycolicibacterium sp. CBMA 213]
MRRGLLVLATATLVLAGCTNDIAGQADKPAGGPPSASVDANLLGSGNFPIKPMAPLGTAGAPLTGALIDARRMADYVVGPWDVDPQMVIPGQARAVIIPDAAALGTILPAAVSNTVTAHHLIYGFASDRQDPNQWRLANTVLRFPDAAAAAAAADDLSAAVTKLSSTPNRAVPIPGHQDARATIYTYGLNPSADAPVTMYSFTPHGPYVVSQLVYAPQQDGAVAAVAATLDAQLPRIDQFVPTDPEQFPTLAMDPTGLLSHTMSAPTYPDPPGARPSDAKIGSYLPRAALHFQDDPVATAPLLDAAGLQEMTYNQTVIYRVKDAAAATKLVNDLADLMARIEVSAHPVNAVDFLPGSRCVQSEVDPTLTNGSIFYCFAALNNSVISVHDADATGARQETAAQYKMLLAP